MKARSRRARVGEVLAGREERWTINWRSRISAQSTGQAAGWNTTHEKVARLEAVFPKRVYSIVIVPYHQHGNVCGAQCHVTHAIPQCLLLRRAVILERGWFSSR